MPQTTLHAFRDKDGTVPLDVWLDHLETRDEEAFVNCLAAITELEKRGYELRRPTADILDDGIYELRPHSAKGQYRILYFFSGQNVVVLTHGFFKKGWPVPLKEINRAKEIRELVRSNPKKYTAEWDY